MPFMTNCNNKGCGKSMIPTLDLKDNEVYCSECGKIIQGMSSFTKTQMKSLKQIRRPAKGAYSIRCLKCKQESMPKTNDANELVCASCDHKYSNISSTFETLIRQAIKNGDQEI